MRVHQNKKQACLSPKAQPATLPRMTKTKLFYWLPPIAWATGIFLMSCLPSREHTPLFAGVDKVFHFGLFGMLSVLFFFAFHYERRHPALKAAILALLLTAAYGAFDELHQSFTATRRVDFIDWLADAAGGALAFLAVLRRRDVEPRMHTN
jgi:VanZ family protein